ncbi:hypothetical protein [Sphingomonas sp. Leaf62]|uniref:hypothetical protein n=1 Tax=Sphingomonas sp. Leaf62 TaxID=1736228 RepID=UPI000AB38968|nr:hypothetical protein [Sphingomonas sp. Leaf62]
MSDTDDDGHVHATERYGPILLQPFTAFQVARWVLKQLLRWTNLYERPQLGSG